jgi:hypothetical protein
MARAAGWSSRRSLCVSREPRTDTVYHPTPGSPTRENAGRRHASVLLTRSPLPVPGDRAWPPPGCDPEAFSFGCLEQPACGSFHMASWVSVSGCSTAASKPVASNATRRTEGVIAHLAPATLWDPKLSHLSAASRMYANDAPLSVWSSRRGGRQGAAQTSWREEPGAKWRKMRS